MGSPTTTVKNLNVMRFGLSEESFAIDMTWVDAIEGSDRLQLRSASDGTIGLLTTVHGQVPVHALGRLLPGQSQAALRDPRVLVLKSGEGHWGLLVGCVTQSRNVPHSACFPLPDGTVDAYTTPWEAVLRLDDHLVLLLGPERLRQGGGDRAAPSWLTAGNDDVGLAPYVGREQIVLFAASDPIPGRRPLVFGLSMTQVVEVVEASRIYPVPGAPTHVAGLLWWRERPVTVIDLAQRVGLPPSQRDERARLLIVRTSARGGLAAFLVRPGVRIRPLPLPHLQTTRPLPTDPAAVLLSVELQGETVIVPDLTRVLQAA